MAARPSVLAIRGEDEVAWTALTLDERGDATVAMPGGAYRVATVCGVVGPIDYRTALAAPSDGAELDVGCGNDDVPDVSVRYPDVEGREVFAGRDPGISGFLRVEPGTYDVVVVDRQLRMRAR